MSEGDATPAPASAAMSGLLASALPGIVSRAKVIVSPYPFGLSDDDNLRVTVITSLPGVTVNIHLRRITSAGERRIDNFALPSGTTYMATSQDFPLGGGFCTNLTAFAAGATPKIGQTFVIVQIINGLGAAAFVLGTLLAGYITTTQPIGWPGSPISNSIEGGGYIRPISGTQPAPGVELFEGAPNGARWEPILFTAVLTTSAAAGTRQPLLEMQSGGLKLIQIGSIANQGPTSGVRYTWAQGLPLVAQLNTSVQLMGLPTNPTMLSGFVLLSATNGLQAGDQWSAPQYVVREWLEAL